MIWLTAAVTLFLLVYLLVALSAPRVVLKGECMSIWVIPILFTATAVALSVPAGLYLAWIMDGRYRAPAWLAWLEKRLDTGRNPGKATPSRSCCSTR